MYPIISGSQASATRRERQGMDSYVVCSDGIIHTELSREEVLRRLSSAPYFAPSENFSFDALLSDILALRIVSEEEIAASLDRLAPPPDKFISLLIARAENSANSESLAAALAGFFPGSHMARRGSLVVLLLSRKDRAARLYAEFDDAALEALLASHSAFAAVGNASSRRDNMRGAYYLTSRTLELGERLRLGRERLFLFEDYAEYIMIDMCAQNFSDRLGNPDLVSLTHPALIRLFRHDAKHGDNLSDILFHYCINDCSVARTAAATYMHRNTIAAKLTKIRSLLDLDLTDGRLRQRIIVSYQLLRYMEKFRHINIIEQIRPE